MASNAVKNRVEVVADGAVEIDLYKAIDWILDGGFARRLQVNLKFDHCIGNVADDSGITKLRHQVYALKPTPAPWGSTGAQVLVVPPSFDSHMLLWLDKAREEALKGVSSTVLVPGQLTKTWFLQKALYSSKQTFIAGMVPFQNGASLQMAALHFTPNGPEKPTLNLEVRDLQWNLLAQAKNG